MERAAPEALGREHATAGLRNGAGAVASGAAARTSRASIYLLTAYNCTIGCFCWKLCDTSNITEHQKPDAASST